MKFLNMKINIKKKKKYSIFFIFRVKFCFLIIFKWERILDQRL
jgi:hypothetical protein